jgi:hypothetical protein
MVGSTSPRTAILFRVYYGLLAVSVALSGALITRPVATASNPPHEIVKPAPHDAKAPIRANSSSRSGLGINWGGQRR